VNESSFTNCNALATGGAVSSSGCNVIVTQSFFQSCASNEGGGAISAILNSDSVATMILIGSSTVLNCSTQGHGGAIFCWAIVNSI
jgi:hypothetical protein